jgi:Domain of unknown function (DUF4912)
VLLVVDPYLVHAYWSVTPEALGQARTGAEEGRAVLRFFDLGNGSWFDVAIDLRVRSTYVRLWAPDKTYFAELGLRGGERDFASIVRSNTVQTPRAWPALAVEEKFAAPEPAKEPAPAPVPLSTVLQEPAHESPVRESAALQSPVRESPVRQPPVPQPADSARILHEKLAQLYAYRRRPEPPRPPQPTEAARRIEVGGSPPDYPSADLTAVAEMRITESSSRIREGGDR